MVIEIGVFRRMDVGDLPSFDGDRLGFGLGSLCCECARELLRELIGIRDGESGRTKSLSEAADNSESLFGVPIIGDSVVGLDTLCLLDDGVFDRTSSTGGATLPLLEALAWVRKFGA